MARVLVAALVAMLISILAGPTFIDFLRRHEFGQHIREEGPQHHSVKQGTPTMGGLLIVLVRNEGHNEGTRLNLLNERIGSLPPYLSRSYHRSDGHPQPLLRAIRRIIDITARRMPDHEDVQIMRRRSMLLQITRSPGTEDQDPLGTV